MARAAAVPRLQSPISSTTDSSRARDSPMMSSNGSKASPSTSHTSISSGTPEQSNAKPEGATSTRAAPGQGVKRKSASQSVFASQIHPQPAKKTRCEPDNSQEDVTIRCEASPPVVDPLLAASAVNRSESPAIHESEAPQPEATALIKSPKRQLLRSPDKRKSPRIKKISTSMIASTYALGKGPRLTATQKRKVLKRKQTLRSRIATGSSKSNAEVVVQDSPKKKTKISVVPVAELAPTGENTVVAKRTLLKKNWLDHGLYVGQQRPADKKQNNSKPNEDGEEELDNSAWKQNKVLPMPMFSGEELLRRGRDFKLPFEVFHPLPRGQPKSDEWWKKQSNRFIGDASVEWKKSKPLPPSRCLCTPEDGCNEDCHNRYMLYECDETNCAIGPEFCTNRAFAELKERSKSGKKYDIGVEVVKTKEKGFGVRPCRTFEPGQVIVEYTGEIITQEECERRMREEYKDNECYYLMTFDQNMIIDATRGSIARFVNHSCEPNCRMIKWTVAGKPRMALFAGDNGIMTGEELTYDYNFDPFSQKNVQVCKCGAPTCRGVLGPRPSKEKEAKLKQMAQAAGQAVVAGAKRKLQSMIGREEDNKTKSKPQKKKPKGTGIWAGKWEWVKVKA